MQLIVNKKGVNFYEICQQLGEEEKNTIIPQSIIHDFIVIPVAMIYLYVYKEVFKSFILK